MTLACYRCGAGPPLRVIEVTFAGDHLADGFLCRDCDFETALKELRADHAAMYQAGVDPAVIVASMRDRVAGKLPQA